MQRGESDTKTKKRLLTCVFAAILTLVLIAAPVLWQIFSSTDGEFYPRAILFAKKELSIDIQNDPTYMAKDRQFYLVSVDGSYSEKAVIEDSARSTYPAPIRLLCTLLDAAIAGDDAAYNACFSTEYIAKESEHHPFTEQKIYDVEIERYYPASISVPTGYENAYLYGLRYKIQDNNGSMRMDVGSDSVREQYVTVVENENGDAFIYGIKVRYIALQ